MGCQFSPTGPEDGVPAVMSHGAILQSEVKQPWDWQKRKDCKNLGLR